MLGLSGGFANPNQYALSADGRRFLMNIPLPQPPTQLSVIINWPASLKK